MLVLRIKIDEDYQQVNQDCCDFTAPYTTYYMPVDHQLSYHIGPILLLLYSLGPGTSY